VRVSGKTGPGSGPMPPLTILAPQRPPYQLSWRHSRRLGQPLNCLRSRAIEHKLSRHEPKIRLDMPRYH
jgi:hypothetical protein